VREVRAEAKVKVKVEVKMTGDGRLKTGGPRIGNQEGKID
jgi:hypothetical protein